MTKVSRALACSAVSADMIEANARAARSSPILAASKRTRLSPAFLGLALGTLGVPKSLRFGQRRKLLAGAVAGRPVAGGNKVGGVLQAEFFVGCQGFHGGLRCVAMAADSARRQERATSNSLTKWDLLRY